MVVIILVNEKLTVKYLIKYSTDGYYVLIYNNWNWTHYSNFSNIPKSSWSKWNMSKSLLWAKLVYIPGIPVALRINSQDKIVKATSDYSLDWYHGGYYYEDSRGYYRYRGTRSYYIYNSNWEQVNLISVPANTIGSWGAWDSLSFKALSVWNKHFLYTTHNWNVYRITVNSVTNKIISNTITPFNGLLYITKNWDVKELENGYKVINSILINKYSYYYYYPRRQHAEYKETLQCDIKDLTTNNIQNNLTINIAHNNTNWRWSNNIIINNLIPDGVISF